MGYESKIFIVERTAVKCYIGSDEDYIIGRIVAEYDLCCLGKDAERFRSIFKNDIDYDLYMPYTTEDGDEVAGFVYKDAYGEHMKSADIEVVISALKEYEKREHYRRLPPLIAMLEAFQSSLSEWCSDKRSLKTAHTRRELQIVHFGH